MTVLGIETSTAVCSVGIVTIDRSAVQTIREDRVHSEKLLTLVAAVLAETNTEFHSVDAVAVSSGPGSFTGLRIGVSAAKGLVAAHGKALLGVPSIVSAVAAARSRGRLSAGGLVLMDARQGEWYVAVCAPDGTVAPVRIENDETVRRMSVGREMLTDRPERFPEASTVWDLLDHLQGDVVARLGRERLERGERDDVTTFEPMYLKEFVVRTPPARGR